MKAIKFGFGTSGIMGAATSNRERLALLEHAFEHGVRHFDTAPLYGHGDAEKLIGQFIVDKRENVSVTTKYGLSPRSYPRYLTPLKPAARFANRRLKQLKEVLESKARNASLIQSEVEQATKANHIKIEAYSVDDIRRQLELSLRKMKMEAVDYFLLHDSSIDHLNDDVVEFLEQAKSDGKLLHYGLATGRAQAALILEQWPEFASVLQHQTEPFTNHSQFKQANRDQQNHSNGKSKRLLITHSLFRGDVFELKNVLIANKPLLDAITRKAGYRNFDIQEIITRFLIHQASLHNQTGILLFSCSSQSRLANNIDAAHNTEFNAQLATCIQELID